MVSRNLSRVILDDLTKIREVDKENMLSFCINAPKLYKEAAEKAQEIIVKYSKPQRIIVAGMGGSAIAGELAKDWARDIIPVPMEVCRDYKLPAYANEETLIIVASYSGETEETLSCLLNAMRKSCKIFCISSNGILLKTASRLNVQTIKIPEGIPPRAALPYMLMSILWILEKLRLVSNIQSEVHEAISVLEQVCNENSPQIPVEENPSKSLAMKINGKIPVIYGFGFYSSVAQRFKQQFNENSKVPAFWNSFPELNHNEIVGWEKTADIVGIFSTVILRDKSEPLEVRSHIEATKEILADRGVEIHEIWSLGTERLAKMLSTILIGDFASIYLAILRGVNPTPIETISRIKRVLLSIGIREKLVAELQSLVGESKVFRQ